MIKKIKAVKQKKCRYKECKKEFTPYNSLEQYCSLDCKIKDTLVKVRKENNKAASEEKREWNKYKKEFKKKDKSVSKKIQAVRKPFQMWIRMRDADKPCISCGTYYSDIWDGGHYSKAETYTGMIFNENNCHKQCRKCNKYLDGNESNYRIGLIKRIGEAAVIEIENTRDSLKSYKWSDDELKEIKDKYTKLLKQQNYETTT